MRGEYGANLSQYTDAMELPPRARRIRWSERQKGNHHGTTSACAENTGWWGAHQHIDGNYLRVRGEYIENYQAMRDKTELPPRARRIQDRPDYFDWIIGTTSACAENTLGWSWADAFLGNYLRVRGEYSRLLPPSRRTGELPPRARRIRVRKHNSQPVSGTTSACAENTIKPPQKLLVWRNYLRVRGEYETGEYWIDHRSELPPRARRIPNMLPTFIRPGGTTSACAENTSLLMRSRISAWNYLRVRGEYTHGRMQMTVKEELPPRARRILLRFSQPSLSHGTTSACAENTAGGESGVFLQWNYLRVRGEYLR